MKKLYLIGKDISHSKSKDIHTIILKTLNISNVVYENLDVGEDEILNVLESLRDENVLGANVTIPFKETAGDYFGNPTPVNTIFKSANGEILTTSTDFRGFRKALNYLKFHDYDVFIFGSGGVSKSISLGLNTIGINPTVVSRTGIVNYQNFNEYKTKKSFLINATPLGTLGKYENESPTELITPGDIVYDLVYNPEETKFIKIGKEKGCKTFNGLDMLIYQAIFSMEYFLNEALDVDSLYSIVKANFKCEHECKDESGMNIKIKRNHFEFSYNVNVECLDVAELHDFSFFVEILFVQSPHLFLTDFTTMFKNKLIKFTRITNHEVFSIEVL